MSSTLVTELTDQDCKKGQLTQRPPIPYATPKAETAMKASRETFKLKTAEGEVKVAVLGDSPGPEEYLQHINSFLRNLSRKKWNVKMTKSIKAVLLATASLKKFARIPVNETDAMTARRSASLVAAAEDRKKAEAHETTEVGLVYDLFRKTLKEDPELQWDRIVDDMHAKDLWEDLRGVKHIGLCISMGVNRFPQAHGVFR